MIERDHNKDRHNWKAFIGYTLLTSKAIAQQRLLVESDYKDVKDFPSLHLLRQLQFNKNPRKTRLLMLLLAFKIFSLEEESSLLELTQQLNLPLFKELVFLNTFEASPEDGLSPTKASKYELAFRSFVWPGTLYNASSSRKNLSPIRGVSPHLKESTDIINQTSFCLDLRQPLEIYCLNKSKLIFEKVIALSLEDLKKNKVDEDLLFLQDPDRYIYCVRSPNLGKPDKLGILKKSPSRLLSPDSPTLKNNRIAAFSCRFKDLQQKTTASTKILGDFLMTNSKPSHRSTKSLGGASLKNLGSFKAAETVDGPTSSSKVISISRMIDLDRSSLLNQNLVIPDMNSKFKLSRGFVIRSRFPQIDHSKGSPVRSKKIALNK